MPVDNIMTQVIPAMAQFTSAASTSSSPLSMPWMPDTAPPPLKLPAASPSSRRHARRGFGLVVLDFFYLLVPNGFNFLLLLLLLYLLLLLLCLLLQAQALEQRFSLSFYFSFFCFWLILFYSIWI